MFRAAKTLKRHSRKEGVQELKEACTHLAADQNGSAFRATVLSRRLVRPASERKHCQPRTERPAHKWQSAGLRRKRAEREARHATRIEKLILAASPQQTKRSGGKKHALRLTASTRPAGHVAGPALVPSTPPAAALARIRRSRRTPRDGATGMLERSTATTLVVTTSVSAPGTSAATETQVLRDQRFKRRESRFAAKQARHEEKASPPRSEPSALCSPAWQLEQRDEARR
eukprot:m.127751 g.127751  ORF g.127751 m.127751 type:complete len:230 (-) comp52272_c0_seq1:532-1221(-)